MDAGFRQLSNGTNNITSRILIMKRNLFSKVFVSFMVAIVLSVGIPASAQESDETKDWREQYAYTLGIQAYVFGFPYVYLPSLRWDWVTQPKPPGNATPYAPLNHFDHSRTLADASYRGGGAPNQDTLYSRAWVDVRKEPVILSHPDMGNRYFTFELSSIDSDNFAYVGQRTSGSKAGSFAIVGPDWKGTLPDGVKRYPSYDADRRRC